MTSPRSKREREDAERAKRERLAYVGTLAAALVHEVRSPLTAIHATTQLLEEDIANLPAEHRETFERRMARISAQTREVMKALDGFLAFARPPRLEPTPIDLNRFLREVIEFAEPEFRASNVDIDCQITSEDMYPVVIDKAQFTQVMLNLFRNAREACSGPTARAARDGERGRVKVTTAEWEDTVEIVVEDNGQGIDPGQEERIFELFYTTKPKGTGLGLGIVRRIVEEHGGRIWAEDRPEGGARFHVTLPRGRFLEFREE